MNSSTAAPVVGWRSAAFTAAQWEELEQQALVYKYLSAGVPVPPELHLAIRRRYEARYYQQAALGYCSYYGKKLDPEPGRCRRTDGKKWRCSKDAYPDSKYCERHMHRGRNRSRKPVEVQSLSHSQSSSSSSSSVTSLTPSGSTSGGCGSLSFQNNPFNSLAGSRSNPPSVSYHAGASSSQLPIDSGSYGLGNKDLRYLHGVKPEGDEHSFFSEASGSARTLRMDSTQDSAWRLMPSRTSSFPPSRDGNRSLLQNNYPQFQPLQGLGQAPINSLSRQQQHYSFIGNEFGSSEAVREESQALRPFFDEWPKTRDSWSDLEDERTNRASFSTTQLSISIPMASSDFSTTSSRSPNDD